LVRIRFRVEIFFCSLFCSFEKGETFSGFKVAGERTETFGWEGRLRVVGKVFVQAMSELIWSEIILGFQLRFGRFGGRRRLEETIPGCERTELDW